MAALLPRKCYKREYIGPDKQLFLHFYWPRTPTAAQQQQKKQCFRIIHNLVDIIPDPLLINDKSNRGHTQRLSQIRARTNKIANRRVLESLPQVVVDQTCKTALVSTSYISNKVFFYRSIIFNNGTFIFLSQSVLPAACVWNAETALYVTVSPLYVAIYYYMWQNCHSMWWSQHYMWHFYS